MDEMLKTIRNVAIIVLLALALTLLPAGANVADGILAALSFCRAAIARC